MTSLYLARHGETIENTNHILQGHLPGTLTEQGIEQAGFLAKELVHITLDLIISSDLTRSIHTAQIINKNRRLTHIQTTLLRERDWGSLTGKSIMSIRDTPVPNDVETLEQMMKRAETFTSYIKTHYSGPRILAVGHGLINRAIQAYILQRSFNEVKRMANAEVRTLIF